VVAFDVERLATSPQDGRTDEDEGEGGITSAREIVAPAKKGRLRTQGPTWQPASAI
jgi:hypothetical protein